MELIQLIDAKISLDSDKIKYQSGETISGSVKIKLNGELDISLVKIVLRSMAEVDWVEMYGSIYFKGGYEYRDHQQYLNVVYEIPENISKTVIKKGSHNIPFEFKLPDDIPSAVASDYGSISFWIEVIIKDNSFGCHVYRDRKYFIVESPLRHNLNLSVGGATEKDIGILSLCLASGKVRIDASIRKKGHTPGETVEVHCLVTNTSTVAVTPRASFFQTQIFMAKEKHKTVEYLCEPVIGEKVEAQQTVEKIILVPIPKDVSLSIKTPLISVKYFIHVTLDIPHSLDLHLNLPIIITNEFALNDRSASFL